MFEQTSEREYIGWFGFWWWARNISFVYFGHSLCEICTCTEGEKVFSRRSNYQQQNNVFAWKTSQLDTASTTNTLTVDDLRTMCPAGFDTHGSIKHSSAVLRTYGGGVIKPVGQTELACETQGKSHTLQFQLLNKDVMGSQPPPLRGSDCVRLGLIEIGGNTCSKKGCLRSVPTWLGTAARKSEEKWNSGSGSQARLTEW